MYTGRLGEGKRDECKTVLKTEENGRASALHFKPSSDAVVRSAWQWQVTDTRTNGKQQRIQKQSPKRTAFSNRPSNSTEEEFIPNKRKSLKK